MVDLILWLFNSKINVLKKVVLVVFLAIIALIFLIIVDYSYFHSELIFIKTKSETITSLMTNVNDTTIDQFKRNVMKEELNQVFMFKHYRESIYELKKEITKTEYTKRGLWIVLYLLTIGSMYLFLAGLLWYSYWISKRKGLPYDIESPRTVKVILFFGIIVALISFFVPPYNYFSLSRMLLNLLYSFISLLLITIAAFSLPVKKI